MRLGVEAERGQAVSVPTMHSTMMNVPLTIGRMLTYGTTYNGGSRIVEVDTSGHATSSSFADFGKRCAALSYGLEGLGVARGHTVGIMLGNRTEALEALVAIPAMGAVAHSINVLLEADVVTSTISSIGEEVIITGPAGLDYLYAALSQLGHLRHIVVLGTSLDAIDTERWTTVQLHAYEQLLDGQPARREWPELDEHSAAVVCHTSGTTGPPKGVVYSHRAIWLHAAQFSAVDGMALSRRNTLLTAVPFYHVMGWGVPFATLLVGNTLIVAQTSPAEMQSPETSIERALRATHPTVLVTTPIHLAELLRGLETRTNVAACLERVIVGGSSLPPALYERVVSDFSFHLVQAWGMTESGPVATSTGAAGAPRSDVSTLENSLQIREAVLSQGRLNPYVDARIVDVTGSPIYGSTGIGELEVRGPFVTGSYVGVPASDERYFDEGWLRTGDIAYITDEGNVVLIDRVADAILSGGEWISSVELENAVMELDTVSEAACIGVPDTRWGQRPLCVVLLKEGVPEPDPHELRAAMHKVEMWKRPDHWAFVRDIPRTSVGKCDKRRLRRRFAQGAFEIHSIDT